MTFDRILTDGEIRWLDAQPHATDAELRELRFIVSARAAFESRLPEIELDPDAPIIIELDPDDWRAALDYESRVFDAFKETGADKRPNYTGHHVEKRFAIGYAGELATHRYLDANFVLHSWKPRANGVPDHHDMLIYGRRQHLPIPVDVKTSGKPFHQGIVFPASQWEKSKCRLLIGTRLENDPDLGTGARVRIFGWIWRKDFAAAPLNGDETTLFHPYADLRPMPELVASVLWRCDSHLAIR